MLVHRRVTPSMTFAGTHLYTWVERGTLRVKCLTQEHNAMSPARARSRTARVGDEHTNHEATAPPTKGTSTMYKIQTIFILLKFESTSILATYISNACIQLRNKYMYEGSSCNPRQNIYKGTDFKCTVCESFCHQFVLPVSFIQHYYLHGLQVK